MFASTNVCMLSMIPIDCLLKTVRDWYQSLTVIVTMPQ